MWIKKCLFLLLWIIGLIILWLTFLRYILYFFLKFYFYFIFELCFNIYMMQVAICNHRNGYVQGYQLLKTDELPRLHPNLSFHPGLYFYFFLQRFQLLTLIRNCYGACKPSFEIFANKLYSRNRNLLAL